MVPMVIASTGRRTAHSTARAVLRLCHGLVRDVEVLQRSLEYRRGRSRCTPSVHAADEGLQRGAIACFLHAPSRPTGATLRSPRAAPPSAGERESCMKRHASYAAAAVIGLSLIVGAGRFPQTVHAQAAGAPSCSRPRVRRWHRFRAWSTHSGRSSATTTATSPGPLPGGRREINWDGGGSTATSIVPTPFDGFLLNRGARFTTAGSGFVQAPVEGLATTFKNPGYVRFFQAFSPVRLFSTIGSNVTFGAFLRPGRGRGSGRHERVRRRLFRRRSK